jgi:hypothetical protein
MMMDGKTNVLWAVARTVLLHSTRNFLHGNETFFVVVDHHPPSKKP